MELSGVTVMVMFLVMVVTCWGIIIGGTRAFHRDGRSDRGNR